MRRIKTLLMALLVATGAQAAEPSMVVRNTPFEARWQAAKVEIDAFACSTSPKCAALASYLRSQAIRSPAAVNTAVNRFLRYRADLAADTWAPPAETFASRRGDCEDYVTLKLVLLRELGFDLADATVEVMRIQGQGHLSLTYAGEVMDFQPLDGAEKLFRIHYGKPGLHLQLVARLGDK